MIHFEKKDEFVSANVLLTRNFLIYIQLMHSLRLTSGFCQPEKVIFKQKRVSIKCDVGFPKTILAV